MHNMLKFTLKCITNREKMTLSVGPLGGVVSQLGGSASLPPKKSCKNIIPVWWE